MERITASLTLLKIYDFQRASFDELNGSSGTSGKQTGLRNSGPQPRGGCSSCKLPCEDLAPMSIPRKVRKIHSLKKKRKKKAKKPSQTTEPIWKPTLGEKTESLACSVRQNKVRKDVRLYQYNEVTMGCRREKQGRRTIKFEDSFIKATLAEDRLVTRTFLDKRVMVSRENSSNRSRNKVKSLNVSFQKYLCSVAAHNVTRGKGFSRRCLPNCPSPGQVSPLQNSMTERERPQKHSVPSSEGRCAPFSEGERG